jgi:hypothetical protein
VTSPFVRRSTTITAGAVVFAGLVAAPIAAFAADPAVIPGPLNGSVDVIADPDGHGDLYRLTDDVSTFTTITMPNDATLDGAGHTITAVEDATHRNFQGSVLASAVGDDDAAAHLDVKNLDITTQGFEGGSNSGGLLNGIYMYRAGGSLTNVSVDGISHGNGVQEGNAISIRNRVSGDNTSVPRASVDLVDIDVTNYQKTGLLLDGNLAFTVKNAAVGQGKGPQGLPNPGIAANSLQISRGASGSVADSVFALNTVFAPGTAAEAPGTAVLLFNAKNVAFEKVSVSGAAEADQGIVVSNNNKTPVDTVFTMRGGAVTRTATPTGGIGLTVEGPAGSTTATVTDSTFAGWASATSGNVTTTTTTPATPAVTKVDVSGTYQATRPHARRMRVHLSAFALGANQEEGTVLRWTIKVDGHRAAAIRQHAGDADVWAQTFRADTGTHTVQILKNGVSQRTYKVRTR